MWIKLDLGLCISRELERVTIIYFMNWVEYLLLAIIFFQVFILLIKFLIFC